MEGIEAKDDQEESSSNQDQDSIADDIDFDVYRKINESYEHWDLRKEFIKTFWDDKLGEHQFLELLSLSEIFSNIEFLECKYSDELMSKIEEKVQKVPAIKLYRESRRNKLKRIFAGSGSKNFGLKNAIKQDRSAAMLSDWSISERQKMDMMTVVERPPVTQVLFLGDILRNVVLIETVNCESQNSELISNAVEALKKAGKASFGYDTPSKSYFFIFNEEIVVRETGNCRKAAKEKAEKSLISALKENCYTIKLKPSCDMFKFGTELAESLKIPQEYLLAHETFDHFKMRIKIEKEFFETPHHTNRMQTIKNLIKQFKSLNAPYSLVFSKDFKKEERDRIKQFALIYGLKAKNHGRNNSRHLEIASKLSPLGLRQKLMEGDDSLLQKYEIIKPHAPLIKKGFMKINEK